MVKRYCPIGEQTNLVLANCLSTFIDDFLETDVKRLGKKGKAGGGGRRERLGWFPSTATRSIPHGSNGKTPKKNKKKVPLGRLFLG